MLCDFFQEGLEYQENLLVDHYRRHGHEVTVICSLYDDLFSYYKDEPVAGSRRDYLYNGAAIIKLPYRYNILHKIRAYPDISPILEQCRPDLIYVHDIMLNFPQCVAYVKRHKDTKMIMDYHADYSNSGQSWLSRKILHGVIRKRVLDRARPYLEKIYPIVPDSFSFLQDIYDVRADEMEMLPLGTDLDYGGAVHADGAGPALRRALGIAPDAFVIFTGGKLNPLKKTEQLIAAVRRIDRPDLHLLIVGSAAAEHGDYRRLLDTAAGSDPRIHFRGWLGKRDTYAHLDAADVAVFAASQSVMWQQAIGMGLPLIVGDRSARFQGRQDATYLNLHDNLISLDPHLPEADAIEAALRALIDDRARVAQMSRGASRTARELLDWNKLIAKTLRFNRASEDEAAVP